MLAFCALLVSFLLTDNLSAQKKIEFTEFTLDNGMHVILHQDNSTPIVAINMYYHVGSKDEKSDRTGFAHFFEHLMFEGSEHIGRGDFFKYVQDAGGQINAFTTFDETVYYEVLPSNQLELGLWMEAERLLHANIDEEGVETQRKVVKEERKQRLDNQPYGSIQEEIFSRSFTEHPYQWTPIGSAQYIDQATLEEFMAFYKKYYVPNNVVLSIAGDINKEETKKLVEKYFGDIPRGADIPRNQIVEPPREAEVRDTIFDNIQLPAVVKSYNIPEKGADDYYALRMLGTLLSGGKSSRLYKALVDEQQIAVQSVSSPYGLEDPGIFIFFSLANQGVDPQKLEEAMDAEIQLVKDELISEREFKKLRNQMENSFYNQNNSMRSIAQNLASYHTFFGDANAVNTEIERFMKVTREDIKRVANEYLTKENRVILYYLPEN